jgi:hypothetical protein
LWQEATLSYNYTGGMPFSEVEKQLSSINHEEGYREAA